MMDSVLYLAMEQISDCKVIPVRFHSRINAIHLVEHCLGLVHGRRNGELQVIPAL